MLSQNIDNIIEKDGKMDFDPNIADSWMICAKEILKLNATFLGIIIFLS